MLAHNQAAIRAANRIRDAQAKGSHDEVKLHNMSEGKK